ncbi:hypothetical protein PF010_g16360 [Phytophthora fragariae]|uniref:RxLR effector protein n=1 Tax=Phytophthora fragariae TaxID=53985 RepID=A0A6A3JJA1_9STRA|nr:hypothetical protein PF011_g17522 [Phytophthora fragariae]KAE9096398.1 hypothetical protein PF010_g16360 [Phytophthora fragariae]KAE9202036.1 hypothetical protein PF004_g18538 [Phytophthora fragariae]KAE9319599.1 hypothetical protein PF008_g18236 [Phytophthora fragariae]
MSSVANIICSLWFTTASVELIGRRTSEAQSGSRSPDTSVPASFTKTWPYNPSVGRLCTDNSWKPTRCSTRHRNTLDR